MKHLMMLSLCAVLVLPSLGCCWSHGHGAGYGGGACSPGYCPPAGGAYGTPFGYAPATQNAYYGATTATAGITPYAPYAISPSLPMTAVTNPLPTY